MGLVSYLTIWNPYRFTATQHHLKKTASGQDGSVTPALDAVAFNYAISFFTGLEETAVVSPDSEIYFHEDLLDITWRPLK